MIPGYATPEGTAAYTHQISGAAPEHWRTSLDLTLSSIGLGSYLGNPDAATDTLYASAVRSCLRGGINVIDTAINYRYQLSERALGNGFKLAIEAKEVNRDQFLVCSKAGYLSGDGGPFEPAEFFQKNFVAPGICQMEDLVDESHCMAPGYLLHQVDQSRKNLGLETIDVYYVHNPEGQLGSVDVDTFYERLTAAFQTLEKCAEEGKIVCYGTATWDGFRVGPEAPNHLSLERVLKCAVDAGGANHRFRVVQLPFNLGLAEALMAKTQDFKGEKATFVEAAYDLGVTVFTSVPLMQSRLVGRMTPELRSRFGDLQKDSHRLIQFVRSAPGIVAPLVGMKSPEHLQENLQLVSIPPLDDAGWQSLFAQA